MERATLVLTHDPDERPAKVPTRYDDDLYGWAMEQAELLKAGRLADLDFLALADEVADVGRREVDKLESDLARIIQHLLKWDHQPERRSRIWVQSIKEHRRRVDRLLDTSPSLTSRRSEALKEALRRGRAEALIETELPDASMPDIDRYSWNDVMTRPIVWPEP